MASAVNTNLWKSYAGKGFSAEYAEYSERANKDANGKLIANTYATKAELSGKADAADIPSSYVESASVSGDTLTLTPNSGSAVTFTASSASNLPAAQGGMDDSLVTTGDKYVWNDWVSADTDIPPINGVRIKGKTYEYKKFGNLLWMTENLKYDINDSTNLQIRNGQYFYRLEYLYGEDFATIIPAGWRIPTQDDRLALYQQASATTNIYKYFTDNCNLEPAYLYNGYGTYPGSYLSGWDSLITTKSSGGAAGGILFRHSDQNFDNSGNLGGNGYQISVPIRFVKDAPIGV